MSITSTHSPTSHSNTEKIIPSPPKNTTNQTKDLQHLQQKITASNPHLTKGAFSPRLNEPSSEDVLEKCTNSTMQIIQRFLPALMQRPEEMQKMENEKFNKKFNQFVETEKQKELKELKDELEKTLSESSVTETTDPELLIGVMRIAPELNELVRIGTKLTKEFVEKYSNQWSQELPKKFPLRKGSPQIVPSSHSHSNVNETLFDKNHFKLEQHTNSLSNRCWSCFRYPKTMVTVAVISVIAYYCLPKW